MDTIIAGSRNIEDYSLLEEAIRLCPWEVTCVVSGTARGADRLGERWACENSVPLQRYPADWDKHGKHAGFIRNDLMARNAQALIALWDGKSRGTLHMIKMARERGLKIHVVTP